MILTIDTTQPMSDADQRVLSALLGTALLADATAEPEPEPEPEEKKPRKRAAKKESEPEPEPEPEPEEPDIGMDLAVSRATTLLAEGKSDTVKEALAVAGAKRVSELTEESVPKFLEALDA